MLIELFLETRKHCLRQIAVFIFFLTRGKCAALMVKKIVRNKSEQSLFSEAIGFPILMFLPLLCSKFPLLQDLWRVFVWLGSLRLQLGSNLDDYVWNVQGAPMLGDLGSRPSHHLTPPSNHFQAGAAKRPARTMPGNALIRQARFTAPPAQHLLTLFPRIWLENLQELVIKTGPQAIHPT